MPAGCRWPYRKRRSHDPPPLLQHEEAAKAEAHLSAPAIEAAMLHLMSATGALAQAVGKFSGASGEEPRPLGRAEAEGLVNAARRALNEVEEAILWLGTPSSPSNRKYPGT